MLLKRSTQATEGWAMALCRWRVLSGRSVKVACKALKTTATQALAWEMWTRCRALSEVPWAEPPGRAWWPRCPSDFPGLCSNRLPGAQVAGPGTTLGVARGWAGRSEAQHPAGLPGRMDGQMDR